ncbi:MAG: tetratricopeptide repeat protein [Roseibacillus sp.]
MSEESKSSTPAAPAPLGEIEHGPSKFDEFMEKNVKKLILLALLIVIGVAAVVIMSQLADAKQREAGNALLAAESPDDYRKVSADFPDSGAAGSAQLLLAGQLWDEGKESEAIETLQALISKSDNLAAAQAKFSLAGMLLKQGKTDEAKANYEALLSNSEAKYLQPMSLVALGDIAQAAGDEEKAKEYYQRKLDEFTAYGDQNLAVTRLNLVGVDSPEKVSPPPAPEPAANPNQGIPSSFTTPIPNPSNPGAPGITIESPTPAIEVAPAPIETPAVEAPEAEAEMAPAAEEEQPEESAEESTPGSDDSSDGETPTFQEATAEEEE